MTLVQPFGQSNEGLEHVGALHFEMLTAPLGRQVDDEAEAVIAAFRGHAELVERLSEAFGRWCLMSEHDRPCGFVGMGRPGLGGLLHHPVKLGQRGGDDHARGLPSIAFFVVNVPHLAVSLKAGDRRAGEHVDALEPAGDGVRSVHEAVSIASDGTAFVSFHLGPRFHPGRPRVKMCGAVGDDYVVEAAP